MTTTSEFLAAAAKEIGYSRWNDPKPGTKYGRWYAEVTGSAGFSASGVPFCAMGLDWTAWNHGMDKGLLGNGKHYAYVPYLLADAKALGRVTSTFQPGLLFAFDWDGDGVADHVGVGEIDLGGGNYQTIEFNTSNGIVTRRVRSRSSILGMIAPAYSASAVNPAPAVKPIPAPEQKPAATSAFVFGPICTKLWQNRLGTQPDGMVSSQPPSNKQYVVNPTTFQFTPAFRSGSSVVLADQKKLSKLGYYTGNIDGWCGPQQIRARATYLAELGYYTLGNEDEYWGPKHSEAFYNALKAGRY